MRIKIFGTALFLLMLNAVLVYGQVTPCFATDDPDGSCPLDTWVIILAALAIVFASIHLIRKHSAQVDGTI